MRETLDCENIRATQTHKNILQVASANLSALLQGNLSSTKDLFEWIVIEVMIEIDVPLYKLRPRDFKSSSVFATTVFRQIHMGAKLSNNLRTTNLPILKPRSVLMFLLDM